MESVSVLGLGKMGSALAGALLRGGYPVTVWNRSLSKAASLGTALVAPSPAAAVAASALSIICVSDYAATRSILSSPGVAESLAGRVLVQLSTGTPAEARDLGEWASAHHCRYLDGGILAWPSHIGGEETLVYVSGDEVAYRDHERTLKALAGRLTYLGSPMGAAATMFSAVLSYLAGRWIGIAHGALVCEAGGLSPTQFGNALSELAPALAWDSRHMGQVIADGNYENPESTLKTAGEDIARLVRHAREERISSEWPTFAASLFHRAISAGHGAEEHAALIKVLRQPAGAAR